MTKVIKTTFDEEQKLKDEAFLALTPLQRWEYAYRIKNYHECVGTSVMSTKNIKTINLK